MVLPRTMMLVVLLALLCRPSHEYPRWLGVKNAVAPFVLSPPSLPSSSLPSSSSLLPPSSRCRGGTVPYAHANGGINAGRRLSADGELERNRGQFINVIRQRSQNTEFTDVSSSERSALKTLLAIHANALTPSELSSVVFSVGLMSQNAKDHRVRFTDELKHLQHGIARVAPSFSPHDVSSVLVGMARMDAAWNDVCRDRALSARISSTLPGMDEKGVGDVVWAVGSMGARWSDLLPALQAALLAALEREGENLNAFALSSALWSMAKMGAKWSQFSPNLQQVYYRRIIDLGHTMSPQQSSKVLWALGTMGASHHAIPARLYEQHIGNVGKIKKSKMGSAVSASQTLTGVAKTGIAWDAVPAGVRPTMWDQLLRVCQSPNDRGIANAIWAMGTLGAPLASQPKPVKDVLLGSATKALADCTAWALCNIVWGTAKMQLDWFERPREFKVALMAAVERLPEEMNGVDVGVLAWSLGALDCPLDTLPEPFVDALLLAVLTNLDGMRPQEIARTIWGLAGTGLSWNALPAPLRWCVFLLWLSFARYDCLH
jgi:hypothetical protein